LLRTIEARIEADGSVQLLEDVALHGPRRALVTVLDEPADEHPLATALLSEAALSDWNRDEEDAAWAHLQQAR
jgi:hypothetical protein